MTIPSKSKLTKAQRAILPFCPDWSAPYEVAARRWSGRSISNPVRAHSLLIELEALGMVEYGPANNVYRITPAGRAALTSGGAEDGKPARGAGK